MDSLRINSDPFVVAGLERLADEAFGSSGFALGTDEVVHVLVHYRTHTFGYGHVVTEGKTTYKNNSFDEDFSTQALDDWLDECRTRAYFPGIGTWTTAEVHVFPSQPGRLHIFDEEHLERMTNGRWYPGGEPADAATWAQQLLAYPRTVDNIPSWMWDIFRAEGVTPPIYNPEFKSVDWKNRRRPVTDRGTDFSIEPTVIDPSLEPGVLSRIGKKLFGSRS
ncbi:hypothetical protein ACIPWF_19010 [Paenarthrobacter sp. NPDC089989]|uniref:hypothetical protein n=1 Tax=unclassified Paenarthrobacter TaxID=2634190 RepID=UPI0037FF0E6F